MQRVSSVVSCQDSPLLLLFHRLSPLIRFVVRICFANENVCHILQVGYCMILEEDSGIGLHTVSRTLYK